MGKAVFGGRYLFVALKLGRGTRLRRGFWPMEAGKASFTMKPARPGPRALAWSNPRQEKKGRFGTERNYLARAEIRWPLGPLSCGAMIPLGLRVAMWCLAGLGSMLAGSQGLVN